MRKAISDYTYQLETKIIDSSNIGSFYRYVNKKLSSHSGIGCLKRDDGSVTNNPTEKSELLNKYFASVFTALQLRSNASAALATAIPSVCLSVCLSVRLSHAGTLPRRMKIGSRGLHHDVA